MGVTLGLPLLNAMQSLRGAETSAPPRRSIFVYLPNGVNTYEYEIATDGRDYEFSKILSPLSKHRAEITPISGLHHPRAFGIAHEATRTWLTGAKHGPTDRNSISVDQLIAGVTGPKTRFPSLELSNQGQPLAVSADGIALPTEKSPALVFQSLFTEPAGGIQKQRRQLQRKESMLDLVLEDAKALANRLDHEDRGRLDQYLVAVREVEIRTRRAEAWLETPRPQIEPAIATHLLYGCGLAISMAMKGHKFRDIVDKKASANIGKKVNVLAVQALVINTLMKTAQATETRQASLASSGNARNIYIYIYVTTGES